MPKLYRPTPEIRTATINWNFKNDDDESIKVEVWDVVDKAQASPDEASGKVGRYQWTSDQIANHMTIIFLGVLDASTIDVYKGANAVIFLFDITKVNGIVLIGEKG